MKTKRSGRTYIVSRVVEEPIDATFELGEEIQQLSGQLSKPVSLGFLGNILLIIFLLPGLISLILLVRNAILGRIELSTNLLLLVLIYIFILTFLLALIITGFLYFTQIKRFNDHLIQRYSVVSELKRKPTDIRSTSKKAEVKVKVKGQEKHYKNPIFAMLDLVEESMHELPQLTKLLRFCIFFITIILVFLVLNFIVEFTIGTGLIFGMNYWEIVTGIVTIVIFIPTIFLLMDSENMVMYLQARHDIIDSVRFEKVLRVPPGKTKIERLVKYLTENDPFFEYAGDDPVKKYKTNVSLKGASGKEYTFDGYFSIFNTLRERSMRLGIPRGKFGVFIKIFKNPITLKDMRELSDAVVDVSEKEKVFPIRIMALQWKVEELDEQVYEYMLENSIIVRGSIAHIQIVAEDGDIYSFIPIISYGKEVAMKA